FLTICLMVGVWASDIGAYFSGKFIGGPKMAPKISPNKTWAGFIGGMLGSALALSAMNYFTLQLSEMTGLEMLPFASLQVAFVIGVFFTVFGQVGDLMVSGYKRKVGVKDTGNLIPGHGGILPAVKLTKEIAEIRHVTMGKDVVSPAAHTAFSSPSGLLKFVEELRDLSGGKPIGFKLCIGKKTDFLSICKAMLDTGIMPDFITVDGGEGGTGAAPTEMTNSVGTPLKDALIFVNSSLIGCGLRDKIKIIASGKIFSAFHLIRTLALGADTVNSARGMMFALGCIQSRSCNTDKCPTGIATQDPSRSGALIVSDKSQRVANFHKETVHNLMELLAAAGLDDLSQLTPEHINRRISGTDIKTYEELYPNICENCLKDTANIPADWQRDWERATASSW
ncbi:MAG: glutamate synthase-related protein, partial [Kangiellaceae bacterium]|nr:glutamate synthase-related protein [Kangiellaceae bacterium]